MAIHNQIWITIHSKELQQVMLFFAGKAVWQTTNLDIVVTQLYKEHGLEQANNGSQEESGMRHVSQHKNARHL